MPHSESSGDLPHSDLHVDHLNFGQESANEAAKTGDGELRFHGARAEFEIYGSTSI